MSTFSASAAVWPGRLLATSFSFANCAIRGTVVASSRFY